MLLFFRRYRNLGLVIVMLGTWSAGISPAAPKPAIKDV